MSGSITGSGLSVILDTASDATGAIQTEGYSQHDFVYEVASIGTSVVCVIDRQLTPGGAFVQCATKTTSVNGNDSISFAGFAVATRLRLLTITGGTPAVRNITGVASAPYRR